MLKLALGPEVIDRLLPHRDPLRLVHGIEGFAAGRSPRLRAWLELDGREPVFAGHFPSVPIWPGAYLIEGVAQCAGLLLALRSIHAHAGELSPSSLADAAANGPIATGLLARASFDFLKPVRPPARIGYEVQWIGEFSGLIRIDGHVVVAHQTVAKGSVTVLPGPLEPT